MRANVLRLRLVLVPLLLVASSDVVHSDASAQSAKPQGTTAAGWRFTNTKFGFSAVFPFDLKEEQKSDTEITVSSANADDTVAYMLSVFSVSPDVLKTKTSAQIIDDAIAGAVDNVKGSLVSKSAVKIDGFPGKAFDIKSEQFIARCRIYLVGKRMYLPMVIFDPAQKLPLEAVAFHAAFKLIEPPK